MVVSPVLAGWLSETSDDTELDLTDAPPGQVAAFLMLIKQYDYDEHPSERLFLDPMEKHKKHDVVLQVALPIIHKYNCTKLFNEVRDLVEKECNLDLLNSLLELYPSVIADLPNSFVEKLRLNLKELDVLSSKNVVTSLMDKSPSLLARVAYYTIYQSFGHGHLKVCPSYNKRKRTAQ